MRKGAKVLEFPLPAQSLLQKGRVYDYSPVINIHIGDKIVKGEYRFYTRQYKHFKKGLAVFVDENDLLLTGVTGWSDIE